GIKLDRSENMIVAILGILKSGAAYVPIDVNYPQDRIAYIEEDSNCKAVIDENILDNFTKVQDKFSKENLNTIIGADDLAYVIYTSGSTGQPKGVMIENKNLYNYLKWCSDFYFENQQQGDFGLFSSLSFDLTVTSIFLPLIRGHKIKVFNNNWNAHEILLDYISTSNALDIVKLTPSHLELLKDFDLKDTPLKKIIVGGESLLSRQVDEILKANDTLTIYNEYGPTESTVGCMVKVISKDSPITIGKPISNTQIYILDDCLNLLPIGVTGKLYISGAGVGRGYLNKAELTQEKFIENPFIEGEKMYDTGDLGRWLADGDLEFLGRIDHQVKIRGYRIELGEIENVILQYSQDLKQVVVAAKESNDEKVLIAYFTTVNTIDKSALRSFLQERLPDYMVPGFYVELEELPLTPNGKINHKALSGADGEDLIRGEYVAPRNETEQKLVAIWQEVLGIEKVGVTDSFFELGGNSLKVMRLLNTIEKTFLFKMPVSQFFDNPNIESFSSVINTLKLSSSNQNRKSIKI
ncbi:non-ribosomal peptide synthetase, partial [Flavobacterium nitrogenifigens]|uniref:non-ribosomal peptide synthetase n=1 Tax=Flavobacterium nitrogenifigens TaxID=1617283 RepID=UPI0013A661E5